MNIASLPGDGFQLGKREDQETIEALRLHLGCRYLSQSDAGERFQRARYTPTTRRLDWIRVQSIGSGTSLPLESLQYFRLANRGTDF